MISLLMLAIHKAPENFLTAGLELHVFFRELWLILSLKLLYVEEVPVCLWNPWLLPSPSNPEEEEEGAAPIFFMYGLIPGLII